MRNWWVQRFSLASSWPGFFSAFPVTLSEHWNIRTIIFAICRRRAQSSVFPCDRTETSVKQLVQRQSSALMMKPNEQLIQIDSNQFYDSLLSFEISERTAIACSSRVCLLRCSSSDHIDLHEVILICSSHPSCHREQSVEKQSPAPKRSSPVSVRDARPSRSWLVHWCRQSLSTVLTRANYSVPLVNCRDGNNNNYWMEDITGNYRIDCHLVFDEARTEKKETEREKKMARYRVSLIDLWKCYQFRRRSQRQQRHA